MNARERLRRYVEERQLSAAGLGRLIGCSQSYAWRILHENANPKIGLALNIERETGIRAPEWAEASAVR